MTNGHLLGTRSITVHKKQTVPVPALAPSLCLCSPPSLLAYLSTPDDRADREYKRIPAGSV
jgi:hypothetical protein